MRTLAIGDIHGFLDAFEAVLAVAQVRPEDRLITLGDYVDRGPDSARVLDRLIQLFDLGQLVPLLGNHDEMFVRARDDMKQRRMWLHFGGQETLESYGHRASDAEFDRVPERHWYFLEHQCREWYESETHIFAHGNIQPALPMDRQPRHILLWERLPGVVAHVSGKRFICGHTKQASGLPLDLGSVVCIDTGVYETDGWLTCLDVEKRCYWQADAYGQTRMGQL